MRHLKSGRKFGMDNSQRKAMLRNMVTSLMLHGRIRTTETRAKDLRRVADRLITLGKRVTPSDLAALEGEELVKARAARVHAIRQVRRWVNDRDALDRVFNEYAERFKDRNGGYTRLAKIGFRAGDNAPMNIIELMPADAEAAPDVPEQDVEAETTAPETTAPETTEPEATEPEATEPEGRDLEGSGEAQPMDILE